MNNDSALVVLHNCEECCTSSESIVSATDRLVICPNCGTTNDFWLDGEDPPIRHLDFLSRVQ